MRATERRRGKNLHSQQEAPNRRGASIYAASGGWWCRESWGERRRGEGKGVLGRQRGEIHADPGSWKTHGGDAPCGLAQPVLNGLDCQAPGTGDRHRAVEEPVDDPTDGTAPLEGRLRPLQGRFGRWRARGTVAHH